MPSLLKALAEILLMALPATLSVAVAPVVVELTTAMLLSNELAMVASLMLDAPCSPLKSSPDSPGALPLPVTLLRVSVKPVTFVPRTPSSCPP